MKILRIVNVSYLLASALKTLVSAIYPFANIVIPKLIIDELLGGKNLYRLAALVSALVGVNLLYRIFISCVDAVLQKQASAIDLRFDFRLSEITMGLPYELLGDLAAERHFPA